jgi:adenine/guanine phosphoribosyltransferase-like PRPP-binding protein
MTLEGDFSVKRYIIVDDFISSGNTMRAIHEDVKAAVPNAQCVGLLMYNQASYYFNKDEYFHPMMMQMIPTLEFMYGIGGFNL